MPQTTPYPIRITDQDSIQLEISRLSVRKKRIESEFANLKKKLIKTRHATVLDSSNWEEWKVLSMEHDEMMKLTAEINAKYTALRRLRCLLKASKGGRLREPASAPAL